MTGVELEDEGGSGSAGSHWERRLVEDDLMVAVVGNNCGMTNLTKLLLEASGWYKINVTYVRPLYWGLNMGCNFFNN